MIGYRTVRDNHIGSSHRIIIDRRAGMKMTRHKRQPAARSSLHTVRFRPPKRLYLLCFAEQIYVCQSARLTRTSIIITIIIRSATQHKSLLALSSCSCAAALTWPNGRFYAKHAPGAAKPKATTQNTLATKNTIGDGCEFAIRD